MWLSTGLRLSAESASLRQLHLSDVFVAYLLSSVRICLSSPGSVASKNTQEACAAADGNYRLNFKRSINQKRSEISNFRRESCCHLLNENDLIFLIVKNPASYFADVYVFYFARNQV